ncbi:hypothetical protein B0H16DRAFT_1336478, partial [Mycena metata]
AADEEDLIPIVEYYWKLGFNDPDIAAHSLDHFERGLFGLRFSHSAKSIQRLRTKLGLQGTRQQAVTAGTITPFYLEIRERYPQMGARTMVATLRQDYSIKVAESFLNKFLKSVEPDAVKQRRVFRFKRKKYWCAGIMDIVCFDQHDKWKKFGLYKHIGVEPYAGQILWLKIWWTNRNPKLVTSYYLEACRRAGGIPLITQSDLGTENYGIANCHTATRQRLDPSLVGTLQHRWMKKMGINIKPEAAWSQMRRQFSPGFENILDDGVARGLYNVDNPVEKLVFLWLAIPWLQAELDAWVHRYNSTPRRRDKNKVLPQGIPDLITAKPHLYGAEDYKAEVLVPTELFNEMEAQWAPPTDPVFDLAPPVFTTKIVAIYESLGSPAVSSTNFWEVYSQLLNSIIPIQEELSAAIHEQDNAFDAPIELLPEQAELRQGANAVAGFEYYGGVPDFAPDAPESGDENGDDEEDHRDFADLTDIESS